jgi:hypothetical protein
MKISLKSIEKKGYRINMPKRTERIKIRVGFVELNIKL